MSSPLRCLADLPDQPPEWLWPGRIPRGALTLLVGDPGRGKSLLTLEIAARVTVGRQWPDGAAASDPGDVLLLSAEDSISRTVRTRLVAFGADLRRVHYLKTAEWTEPIKIPKEQDPKRDAAYELTAFGFQPPFMMRPFHHDSILLTSALDKLPNCRLVVIDPFPAYVEHAWSDNAETARTRLTPLVTLAERGNVAMLAVVQRDLAMAGPTPKRDPRLHTLAAMARAIYLIDAAADDPRRRQLVPVKNNLGLIGDALAFDVHEAPAGGAVLSWHADRLQLLPSELPELGPPPAKRGPPPSQLNRAIAWLEGALAAGPVSSRDLTARAELVGIAEQLLKRARERLSVTATKHGAEPGCWICNLPPKSDEKGRRAS